MRDDAITLGDTDVRELPAICEMEQGEARHFILPYSLDTHQQEFARPTVTYKSIRRGGTLVGFVILVLDPDGQSVEFRRIVVTEPGRGIGRRAVDIVRQLCRHELGRTRVWLGCSNRTNEPGGCTRGPVTRGSDPRCMTDAPYSCTRRRHSTPPGPVNARVN